MLDTTKGYEGIHASAARKSLIKRHKKTWLGTALALVVLSGGAFVRHGFLNSSAEASLPPAPTVYVSAPVSRDVEKRLQFLGQFSAVQQVELRPQVGGTLTEISFKDGDIVQKGDVLFEIDPTPYDIKLRQATAQLETANARLELAVRQSDRANSLKQSGYGTIENADQRTSDRQAAKAAVDNAEAAVRDAQFDLDHTRVKAPFTGRIGTHLVSVGNLVAGSRAAISPTTLLATLVSIDSVYLNFDMSEADYASFQKQRQNRKGVLSDKIEISLNNGDFDHQGTLDFIDNRLDRSSGTIHARATVQDLDNSLTPGAFARIRLAISKPEPALLVPDASVLPDQTNHIVLTVGSDGVVAPKVVEIGDLRNGLRVIHSGLQPSDQVVVAGVPLARPGSKVTPEQKPIQNASN